MVRLTLKNRVRASVVLLMIFLATLVLPTIASAVHPPYGGDPLFYRLPTRAWTYYLEQGDFLVTFMYDLPYLSGSRPSEPVNETYIARFTTSGGTSMGEATPYAYYDDGYQVGFCSFYWTATEVVDKGFVWGSSDYRVEFSGNPTLSWNPGSRPYVLTSDIDWQDNIPTSQADTESDIKDYIVEISGYLEGEWGSTYLMIDDATKTLLEDGETYFINSLTFFKAACPSIFEESTVYASIEEQDFDQSYANELRDPDNPGSIWYGKTDVNDAFDDLADYFKIPTMLMKSFLFLIAMSVIFYAIVSTVGINGPIMLLSLPILFMGNMWGFLPLELTIILAFFTVLGMGYVFFYRQA